MVGNASAFFYVGILGSMFSAGAVNVIWGICLLLLLLFVIALIVLFTLQFLCDLNVIKNEKLYNICQKINTKLAGFNIAFVLIIALCVIIATESVQAVGWAFTILELVITIATLVMINQSKKAVVATGEQPKEEVKEQVEEAQKEE